MTDVLDTRTLNRTLLQRQMLLERQPLQPLDALEHLVGLQAQAPNPPYVALWNRLSNFDPLSLARLIETKQAVRVAAMRSTVQLVTATDCFALRALTQTAIERSTMSNHGKTLANIDLKAVGDRTRHILRTGPLAPPELGEQLRKYWPEGSAADLAMLARAALPLIQPPPRGLWRKSGKTMVLPAEQWLGPPLIKQESLEQIILRYLAAFGPASIMDFQAWSGITRTAAAFTALGNELVEYKNDSGRTLFDGAHLKLARKTEPTAVRFLGEYDNLTLSHADRGRIISDDFRKRIASKNGQVPGTILIDGFVGGTWRAPKNTKTITLEVTPFIKLTQKQRAEMKTEGLKLLEFLAPELASHYTEQD